MSGRDKEIEMGEKEREKTQPWAIMSRVIDTIGGRHTRHSRRQKSLSEREITHTQLFVNHTKSKYSN